MWYKMCLDAPSQTILTRNMRNIYFIKCLLHQLHILHFVFWVNDLIWNIKVDVDEIMFLYLI